MENLGCVGWSYATMENWVALGDLIQPSQNWVVCLLIFCNHAKIGLCWVILCNHWVILCNHGKNRLCSVVWCNYVKIGLRWGTWLILWTMAKLGCIGWSIEPWKIWVVLSYLMQPCRKSRSDCISWSSDLINHRQSGLRWVIQFNHARN